MPIRGLAPRRDHQDRHRRARAELPTHLEAIEPRQVEVEQHHVGLQAQDARHHQLAAALQVDLEVVGAQVLGDEPGQALIVLDVEDPDRRHRRQYRTRRRRRRRSETR
jgi:hypothetical protein